MNYSKLIFLFIQIINFSLCYAEVILDKNCKLLNGFIDYYNNLPNQVYTCESGTIAKAEKLDENSYKIEVNLQVAETTNLKNKKVLKCSSTVQDLQDSGVVVLNNDYACQEQGETKGEEEKTQREEEKRREEFKPLQLENQIQTNTDVTSGEQFIAVPREEPTVPCVGCTVHVNPQAVGVSELALLGIRHLDRHEASVKHSLKSVVDVERQVQVVNGVRYILTLLIDYNSCTDKLDESCQSTKPCKISVLEKPWVRLPNGGKYRAIVANNCTEEWLFGDNGEILEESLYNNTQKNEIDINPNTNYAGDDNIKVIHTVETLSQKNQKRVLNDDQIKNIEEQIIPHKHFIQNSINKKEDSVSLSESNEEYSAKEEIKPNENSVSSTNKKEEPNPLNQNKKKAIDDLINFFNLYDSHSEQHDYKIPRIKRSYDLDLQTMSLAEKIRNLQNSLNSGKHLYNLAQTMVDYINEMDLEVKTRVLNDVLKADEEIENYQHYFYIQARVIIPCEKAECHPKDTIIKICNGVIDDTDSINPRVLNAFCYNEQEERELNKINSVSLNDPVLLKLVKQGVAKIETESSKQNAIKIKRIIDASTQKLSGTITKFTILLDYLSCTKDIPLGLRHNCTVLEQLGSNICDIMVHERHWLKEAKITYTCIERPIEGSFSNQANKETLNVDDPKVVEMVQEALQYLEIQSNKYNKQKVISINSVSTELNAGLLTNIVFIVGYTDCTNDIENDLNQCKVLENEPIRKCKAQIWDRTWIEDGKKVEVTCEDVLNTNNHNIVTKNRNKRSFDFVRGIETQNVNSTQYKTSSEEYVQKFSHVPTRKRNQQGGVKEQDPSDPKYKHLAEESLKKYLQNSGITQSHRVISIDKVSSQVVSGMKTNMDFTISSTIEGSGEVLKCHSVIWEQMWLKKRDIDVDCEVVQRREIRSILMKGSRTTEDPTKSKFKRLAQESLKEYGRSNKNKFAHKVVEVKRVISQLVAGMIYNIDFISVPTSCSIAMHDVSLCKERYAGDLLYCHARIWSKPWMDSKDITVSCYTHKKKSFDVKNTNKHINKRQVMNDEDYIDEDLRYHYAERAIQHVNRKSQSNNLYKLVTIYTLQNTVQMGANLVRMFIEIAPTFCLRHTDEKDLQNCEEMDGLNHKLCLARIWPSPDDELAVQSVNVICDDDNSFESVTGLSMKELLKASLKELEKFHDQRYKLVHLGEPHLVPNFDPDVPTTLSFIAGFTNCTKDVDFEHSPYQCFLDETKSTKPCTSFIWFIPNSRKIYQLNVKCTEPSTRRKRSVPLTAENATVDDIEIQKLVQQSLEKLEMSSIHRYKQRVLIINGYSTKITTGKVTTIDFDVGYTSCLKYEWVDDVTTCEFLEHLPRRHCVSQIFERLWLQNGKNIEVHCEDDETPLEAHIEFESAEMAMELAKESLKHIEAKYPYPRKQKIVRIFSLDKQVVAGIHYRMKIEVGITNCTALSSETDCKLVKDEGINKFCRVNVWLRPWTDHPPNYRVTCDYQESATAEVYHHIQAEHLFYNFVSTYRPDYINDHNEMRKRFNIFKKNVRRIHELNIHERGTATYGVTRFADLSYEEFSTKYMGLKPSLRNYNQTPMRKAEIPKSDIPDKFDWRDSNTVTEVKDQGSCGSCWAFSVTGNIEGQWKLKTGDLISLSEQELVDCDKLDQGCSGGLPDNAYRAIEQLGGLEKESDYPYEGADDKCVFNKTLSKVQISGAVNISSNETDMAKWLVHNGPISIGINANAMQFYMGGISHPWRMLCNPSNLDHGVLLVGYGIKDYPLFHKRLPYWTIKNSWGKSWGEQGYYRVYRGDGTCGVNQMASSAVV